MKTSVVVSKIAFLILTVGVLVPKNTFSQQKFSGKNIMTTEWKGRTVKYVDGEIGAKLREGYTEADIAPILNKFNAKMKRGFGKLRWGWIALPEGSDIKPTIEELKKHPAVESVSPNYVMKLQSEPNDPYFKGTSPLTYAHQWSLKNTGQTPPTGTADADIDAPEAWDLTTGSPDVVIAILDSGIPKLNGVLSHPDLDDPNRIIQGPDFADDGDGVKDNRGHGTHVAGIIAAETNNNLGIAGIAHNSKILVIQISDAFGNMSLAAMQDGFEYAVDYAIANPSIRLVINCSNSYWDGDDGLFTVVSYANDHNVAVVATAGNDTGPVRFPAGFSSDLPNVIAVTATDHNDYIASYSCAGSQVNICAPGGYGEYLDGNVYRWNGTNNLGKNIVSTFPNYPFTLKTQPLEGLQYTSDASYDYGYLSGTSMAAPHVAGVVGLMLSVNPSLTAAQIRTTIQKSADKVAGMGG